MAPRLRKMAEVLVRYSVDVQPGNWVTILAPIPGEPLAVECTRAVLEAGGKPWTTFPSQDVHETILRAGTPDQIAFIAPSMRLECEQSDRHIIIQAPANTKALQSERSDRMAMEGKAWGPLMEMVICRTAEGSLKWTIAQQPTTAAAQDAGMSLSEYEDFVFGAGLLNEPDPVAAWASLCEYEKRIGDWLSTKSEVWVKGPKTDLRVGIGGRTWIADDGRLNFPGGEVFTGPLEDSAEGEIAFTFPGFHLGKEVADMKLRFRAGEVVEASAGSNEDFLTEMLGLDAGAKRLGELAFGLNQGIQVFTKNVLFDEKIGGTMHLALGASFPDTGGTNQSDLHWDIVFDLRRGGEVFVDGEPFSRDGKILI